MTSQKDSSAEGRTFTKDELRTLHSALVDGVDWQLSLSNSWTSAGKKNKQRALQCATRYGKLREKVLRMLI